MFLDRRKIWKVSSRPVTHVSTTAVTPHAPTILSNIRVHVRANLLVVVLDVGIQGLLTLFLIHVLIHVLVVMVGGSLGVVDGPWVIVVTSVVVVKWYTIVTSDYRVYR